MDIERFIEAHNNGYYGYSNFKTACAEIKGGEKTSHWMWYIFPQIDGLGKTNMSILFSIKSIEEAKLFLYNDIVGKNLIEITNLLFNIEGKTCIEIFGEGDALKLLSYMTLFSKIYKLTKKNNKKNNIFEKVIEKYGKNDVMTTIILESMILQNKVLQNKVLQNNVLQNNSICNLLLKYKI